MKQIKKGYVIIGIIFLFILILFVIPQIKIPMTMDCELSKNPNTFSGKVKLLDYVFNTKEMYDAQQIGENGTSYWIQGYDECFYINIGE